MPEMPEDYGLDEPPPDRNTSSAGKTGAGRKGPSSQASELVELALERNRLGRATTGEHFAVALEGPHVARMLRGGEDSLRAELAALYSEQKGRAPSSSALADAMNVLQGLAQRQVPEALSLRVAEHAGEVILDLGDETGRVVAANGAGWQLLERGPVLFRRTSLTSSLPAPTAGGDLTELQRMLNVAPEAWSLLLGWMIASFLPGIPHPIALFTGEQGSGKSTSARMLVRLLDPAAAELRSSPRDEEQWAVAANGSWVVAIDNVSTVPPWMSDAFCRAVTGDGSVRRQLYTDAGLTVLSIRRVLLLTSIDAGALRGDLADRILPIEMEAIGPGARREETEVLAAFDQARPRLVGAVLDLLVQVLASRPKVRPAELPRMADFGRVLAAVDQVLGTESLKSYIEQARRIAIDLVEADPVAAAIQRLVERRDGTAWAGSPAELHEVLTPNDPPKRWPADATRLSGRLRRAAPALRSVGIDVAIRKANGRRLVKIQTGTLEGPAGTLGGTLSSPSVPAEPAGESGIGRDRDARDAKPPLLSAGMQKEKEGERGAEEGRGEERRISASSASLASLDPDGWIEEEF